MVSKHVVADNLMVVKLLEVVEWPVAPGSGAPGRLEVADGILVSPPIRPLDVYAIVSAGSTAMHERLPKLKRLPAMLPSEALVRIELQEGIPIFKATCAVQKRIELLLAKQQQEGLTTAEGEELDRYEELDDYLSFANRVMRNLILAEPHL